jgi:hypothetical protein
MRSRNLLPALAAAMMCACATVPGHPPSLPSARELPTDPHGSWIVIKNQMEIVTAGELLAVEHDSTVYIWTDGARIVSIHDRDIQSAHMVRFDPRAGEIAGATFGGVLSTLSNGWALIFTAPAWIIVGTIATASRSNEPHMYLHKHDWKPIVPYARFPGGLPPGFLTTPPPSPPPVVARAEPPPVPEPVRNQPPEPPSPADLHHFATHLGLGVGFHQHLSDQYPGDTSIEHSGLAFIGGIDARVKWPLYVSTRVAIAHREASSASLEGDFAKSGESFDLAFLIGLQGHKRRVRPGFSFGPAAVGSSIGDLADVDFALAFQAELMVDVTENIATGVIGAYDKNDKRDFYVVALGVRFVFW